ncbi:type II toxin-antitoxin system RelE/ParE family toxin [Candidatus Sumerlaeota bacterium]|nr:type II toxin-antitoxin system RelE/ParE family toxin [Candidatus Sumerlaeota bacterium]
MKYSVFLSAHAARDLSRFHGPIHLRLKSAIEALANDPRPRGLRKMTTSGEWRLRVGAYRIRYLIDDSGHVVTVTHIGHRRDIYDH